MAWNKPSESAKSEARNAKKASSVKKGIVAGAAVAVALGALCLWIFSGEGKRQDAASTKDRGLIKDVAPAVAPKAEEPKPEQTKPIDPNARPTKVGEVVNGYVKLPSGRIHKRVGVITNSVAGRPKGWYHIFEHSSENEIACYLTLKPGDTLIGTPHYNGRFKKDFLESLKTPIIPTKDDTPEQAQLKRDVNAAKIELKAALDRGEDIEQIMLNTRQEFQDLMRYKMELKQQFNEMRLKDCQTEEDVENLLDACNKMLEQKGIAPMKFGPITRKRLMQQKEQK